MKVDTKWQELQQRYLMLLKGQTLVLKSTYEIYEGDRFIAEGVLVFIHNSMAEFQLDSDFKYFNTNKFNFKLID